MAYQLLPTQGIDRNYAAAAAAQARRDLRSLTPSIRDGTGRQNDGGAMTADTVQKFNLNFDAGVVTLNVGGTLFHTSADTLRDSGSAYFESLLSGRWNSTVDAQGAFFIDRSGAYFEPVLSFMRTKKLIVPRGLDLEAIREEASFFLLPNLIAAVDVRLAVPVEVPVNPKNLRVAYNGCYVTEDGRFALCFGTPRDRTRTGGAGGDAGGGAGGEATTSNPAAALAATAYAALTIGGVEEATEAPLMDAETTALPEPWQEEGSVLFIGDHLNLRGGEPFDAASQAFAARSMGAVPDFWRGSNLDRIAYYVNHFVRRGTYERKGHRLAITLPAQPNSGRGALTMGLLRDGKRVASERNYVWSHGSTSIAGCPRDLASDRDHPVDPAVAMELLMFNTAFRTDSSSRDSPLAGSEMYAPLRFHKFT